MFYQIESSTIWVSGKEAASKLLEEYPQLRNFGFCEKPRSVPTGCWIRDENNNCIWQEGEPRIVYDPYIELHSLEDLERLMKEVEEPLVVSPGVIEIYDGYRE